MENYSQQSLWIRGYTADGYQLSLTLAITSVADALRLLDEVRSAGILPREAGMEPGEEKEAVDTVVRRASAKGTPIIDFYPQWKYEGKFGVNKYAHLYLDTPDDVAQFEAQSGLRLADLPLYESDTPMKRTFGHRHRCEVPIKRSFEMKRTPDGQYDTGMPKYAYSYAAPLKPTVTPPHWIADKSAKERLAVKLDALGLRNNDAEMTKMLATIEPGNVLSRVIDTTLTEDQFMKRLDELYATPAPADASH